MSLGQSLGSGMRQREGLAAWGRSCHLPSSSRRTVFHAAGKAVPRRGGTGGMRGGGQHQRQQAAGWAAASMRAASRRGAHVVPLQGRVTTAVTVLVAFVSSVSLREHCSGKGNQASSQRCNPDMHRAACGVARRPAPRLAQPAVHRPGTYLAVHHPDGGPLRVHLLEHIFPEPSPSVGVVAGVGAEGRAGAVDLCHDCSRRDGVGSQAEGGQGEGRAEVGARVARAQLLARRAPARWQAEVGGGGPSGESRRGACSATPPALPRPPPAPHALHSTRPASQPASCG